tara:strand:+ start:1443 stop:2120 length:678 start_codon:yes stop_codon:yes gene_type:complete
MTRFEIVLDTETTGLDAAGEDRIVEIGCVELENHLPTGRTFHQYVNPERDMPEEAFKVHGLSETFLSQKPTFSQIAQKFLDFIDDRTLVIHNAEFDMAFINAELKRINRPEVPAARAVDTLKIARERFPGAPASLDALCRRFGVNNTARTQHGALLDSQILAEVYLELIGGRQQALVLQANIEKSVKENITEKKRLAARPHSASDTELADHMILVDSIPKAIWRR